MNINESILATLAYHDIFQYPLTKEELYPLLISKVQNARTLEKALKNLEKSNKIGFINNHYFLKGSKNSINLRQKRKGYSATKHRWARVYVNLMKIIPGVKLVAITGALSMNNSKEKDDIDFMVITSQKKLWTTRFATNAALFPFKRSPKLKRQNNKACLNIFLDESDLTIKNKNLYTAHEIAQMKVIYERGNTYKKFINANKWVYKFLPNWEPKIKSKSRTKLFKYPILPFIQITFDIAENVLKKFQLNYMKSKITNEQLSNTQLFFHPQKTQEIILNKYMQKLKSMHILDKKYSNLR